MLHLVSSLNPIQGGVSQAIRTLIPELSALGVQTEVVCLDDPNADFLGSDAFPIHALGAGKTNWQYHSALYPWLLQELTNYDTVIVHGIWQYHNIAVYRAIDTLKKRGVSPLPKVYLMPHGMLDPWFQQSATRRWKAIRNTLYWKLIQEKVIRSVHGLLFTCEEELRLAATTFRPYRPQAVVDIGYGIAESPIYRQSMQQAFSLACPKLQERGYFLFLGRIDPKKGVDLLLSAYEQLLAEAPDSRKLPDVVIAGPGLESAYGREMQNRVRQSLLLQNRVYFTGMLSGDAKWGAIYGCEAFVLPSHQENFGIAVVEALACGKAVLISDKVNIWREIEKAGAGFISPDTLEGTKENLQNFVNLTSLQKEQLSIAAKRTYEQYFRAERAAARLLTCITK